KRANQRSLLASCPQAASMSFPRLRRTLTTMPDSVRRLMYASITWGAACSKVPPSIGLYSIRFTLHGTCLQNFTSASISREVSLIPFHTTYSYVTRLLVLEYQY